MSLPLYGRIAGWFLLNLFLVGVILYVFTRSLFPAEGQLSASASERVNTLASLVGSKLQHLDESEWLDELANLQQKHHFDFQPYTLGGHPPRGMQFETPSDVLAELAKFTTAPETASRRVRAGASTLRGERGAQNSQSTQQRRQGPGNRSRQGPRQLQRDDNNNLMERPRAIQRSSPQQLKVQSLAAYQDTEDNHWFLAQVTLGPPRHNDYRRPHALLLLMKASDRASKNMTFDSRPWWLLGLSILVLGLGMWVPFTWNLTKYISQLTDTTETIARGNFEIRNASHRRDELGRLGTAIDQLAHRLNGFVGGQRRFMSDIAHELCGPLVRMQLSLGVIELNPEKTEDKLAGLRLEIDEMNKMVEELLDFSRASLSPDKVELENVDLHQLVNSAFARECAPNSVNKIPTSATAQANRHLLSRALGNIIRNSIRYAGTNSLITVSSEETKHTITLHLDDKGPGIPDQHLTKIFDPFYRTDTARAREDGGTGLGLAIVDTCVKACLGEVSCSNLSPTGLRVSITLDKTH